MDNCLVIDSQTLACYMNPMEAAPEWALDAAFCFLGIPRFTADGVSEMWRDNVPLAETRYIIDEFRNSDWRSVGSFGEVILLKTREVPLFSGIAEQDGANKMTLGIGPMQSKGLMWDIMTTGTPGEAVVALVCGMYVINMDVFSLPRVEAYLLDHVELLFRIRATSQTFDRTCVIGDADLKVLRPELEIIRKNALQCTGDEQLTGAGFCPGQLGGIRSAEQGLGFHRYGLTRDGDVVAGCWLQVSIKGGEITRMFAGVVTWGDSASVFCVCEHEIHNYVRNTQSALWTDIRMIALSGFQTSKCVYGIIPETVVRRLDLKEP